jgi:hypothetical protein
MTCLAFSDSDGGACCARRIFFAVPKTTAKPKAAPPVETLVEEARKHLTEHGVVKLTSIAPKAVRDAVVSSLVQCGFEQTKSSLRVPLATQLRNALAHGTTISRSALGAHLRGATKPEITSTVDAAVRQGLVHRVWRGRAESVVAVGAEVLPAEGIDLLSAQLGELAKALAKAQKAPGLTLLTSDVREALEKAQRSLPLTPMKKPPTAVDRVLQTVDSVRDSKTGLSFIPKVIAQLSNTMDTTTATRALLQAAEHDLLELRPEGGLARLSQAELALCPPGPQGTRLSWARRLSGGTT